MQCRFCGLENPEGTVICSRCGTVLGKSAISENNNQNDANVVAGQDSKVGNDRGACDFCGYPLLPNTKVCPNCHKTLVGEELKPVPEPKEKADDIRERENVEEKKNDPRKTVLAGASVIDPKKTVLAGAPVTDPKKTVVAVPVADPKKTVVASAPVVDPKKTVVAGAPATGPKKIEEAAPVADPKKTVVANAPVADPKKTVVAAPVADPKKTVVASVPVADPKKTVVASAPVYNPKVTVPEFKPKATVAVNKPEQSVKEAKKTINPYANIQHSQPAKEAYCAIEPVPDSPGEAGRLKKFEFDKQQVVLRRDNTEPGNSSITSKEQAVLTYENGLWYVEDKSTFQTTFLRAGRKLQLQDGDIILLGDRKFVFKTKK